MLDADLWEAAAAPDAEVPDELMAILIAELGDRALGFTVRDEGSAAWVVDKLLGYDERTERLKAQFLTMVRALEADKARFERRFLPELEAWFDAQPKRGKSLSLLTGTLSKRTVPGAPAIVDEAEALTWAQANLPEGVRTVPATVKLDGAAIRAHVKETGEVVPGVEWREARETFSVSGLKALKEGA